MTGDLRRRLDNAFGEAKSDRPETDKQKTIADLRRRLERVIEHRYGPAEAKPVDQQEAQPTETVESLDIDRLVPGAFRETTAGPAFVGSRRYRLFHHQGNVPLDAFLEIDTKELARFCGDRRLAGLDPRRTLFIDTETTGLAGGTGSYAFLIGAGFFTEDGFIVEQFFMRDFGEETAALTAFAKLAENFDTLVSFNGKSFDQILLDTRFVMNRIDLQLAKWPHLDLLHPSRRLWRSRLPDCRLGTIEENILDLGRHEDIPGSEIPEAYFEYVRQRDARTIARVFRHNEIDIVSLVSLAVRIARIINDGPGGKDAGPHELYALGRYRTALGQHQRAADCLAAARELTPDEQLLSLIEQELTWAYKRLSRLDLAVPIWERMTGRGGDPFPYIELAKYHEHQTKELEHALDYTDNALKRCRGLEPGRIQELEYRRARLLRRLSLVDDD